MTTRKAVEVISLPYLGLAIALEWYGFTPDSYQIYNHYFNRQVRLNEDSKL